MVELVTSPSSTRANVNSGVVNPVRSGLPNLRVQFSRKLTDTNDWYIIHDDIMQPTYWQTTIVEGQRIILDIKGQYRRRRLVRYCRFNLGKWGLWFSVDGREGKERLNMANVNPYCNVVNVQTQIPRVLRNIDDSRAAITRVKITKECIKISSEMDTRFGGSGDRRFL